MKVETNQNMISTVVGNTEAKSGQFSIDQNNFAHITKLLSKSLYSNPIRTLMIEYVQNAIDAHIKINAESNVKVILPTYQSPFYTVIDYGGGMSPDFVLNKLTKYGTSTKSKSNKYAGGFGIGFKASAIYCDNFTMFINYHGYRYTYDVTNCEGSGNITLLDKEKYADAIDGTTIQIPVEEKDIKTFHELAPQLYRCLQNKVEVYEKDGDNITIIPLNQSSIPMTTISPTVIIQQVTNTTPVISLFVEDIHIQDITDKWNFASQAKRIFNNSGKLYFNNQQYKFINNIWDLIEDIINGYKGTCRIGKLSVDINVPMDRFELTINREAFIQSDEWYMYIIEQLASVIQYYMDKQLVEYNSFTEQTPTSTLLSAILTNYVSVKHFTREDMLNSQCIKLLYNRLCDVLDNVGEYNKFNYTTLTHTPVNVLMQHAGIKHNIGLKATDFEYQPNNINYELYWSYTLDDILNTTTIIVDGTANTRTTLYRRFSNRICSKANIVGEKYCVLRQIADNIDAAELTKIADFLTKLFPEKKVVLLLKEQRVAKQKQIVEHSHVYGYVSGRAQIDDGCNQALLTSKGTPYTSKSINRICNILRDDVYCTYSIIKLPKEVEYNASNIMQYVGGLINKTFTNITYTPTNLTEVFRLVNHLYLNNTYFIVVPYDYNEKNAVFKVTTFKDIIKPIAISNIQLSTLQKVYTIYNQIHCCYYNDIRDVVCDNPQKYAKLWQYFIECLGLYNITIKEWNQMLNLIRFTKIVDCASCPPLCDSQTQFINTLANTINWRLDDSSEEIILKLMECIAKYYKLDE